jgi:hypothetical protein
LFNRHCRTYREEGNNTEETDMVSNEANVDVYFDMIVMPNPFNEQAILNIHSMSDELVNIEVFNMIGKMVWNQVVQSKTNVSFGVELAQGAYIVKAINQSGNQAMLRFIKSK